MSPTLWYGLGMDQAIYAYGAWVWKTYHLPPYVGAWDQNFPGIFIIHRLAMALFGASILGFRLFDFLLQIGSLAMIFYLARRLSGSSAAAFLTCIFYSLFYVGRGRWDAGQRDAFVFTALLAAAFLSVVLARKVGMRAAATGFLAGFAFLVRPTYGLSWPVLAFFFLATRDKSKPKRIWAELCLFGACCLIPVLAVALYYWHQGYISELWRGPVLYNFEVYSKLKPPEIVQSSLAKILFALNSIFAGQPLIALLVLFAVLFEPKTGAGELKHRDVFHLILSLTLVSAVSYLILGKNLQYQLIPFWGFMIIMSSVAVRQISSVVARCAQGLRGRTAALIFYLLLIAFMFASIPPAWINFAFQHPFGNFESAYLSGADANDQLLSDNHYLAAKYLKSVIGPEDELEVFSAHPLISFLLKKKLPSRFCLVQHLMFGPKGQSLHPLQRQWIQEYTSAVISARPRFFVIADQGIYFSTNLSEPTIGRGLEEYFPELRRFLSENYRPLAKVRDTEIYELRAANQAGPRSK